jgi:hypothetical protein
MWRIEIYHSHNLLQASLVLLLALLIIQILTHEILIRTKHSARMLLQRKLTK